jgi:hypothetical protein
MNPGGAGVDRMIAMIPPNDGRCPRREGFFIGATLGYANNPSPFSMSILRDFSGLSEEKRRERFQEISHSHLVRSRR